MPIPTASITIPPLISNVPVPDPSPSQLQALRGALGGIGDQLKALMPASSGPRPPPLPGGFSPPLPPVPAGQAIAEGAADLAKYKEWTARQSPESLKGLNAQQRYFRYQDYLKALGEAAKAKLGGKESVVDAGAQKLKALAAGAKEKVPGLLRALAPEATAVAKGLAFKVAPPLAAGAATFLTPIPGDMGIANEIDEEGLLRNWRKQQGYPVRDPFPVAGRGGGYEMAMGPVQIPPQVALEIGEPIIDPRLSVLIGEPTFPEAQAGQQFDFSGAGAPQQVLDPAALEEFGRLVSGGR